MSDLKFAEYAVKHLCGWPGGDLVKREVAAMAAHLPKFHVTGAGPDDWKGKRRMLFEVNRKVLGEDTPNYPQEIGDCTSFAAKNVMEHVQCAQILLDGRNEKFRPVFPSYFYGCSRVYIGGSKIWGDGSLGVWTQEAAKKYGVLASDDQGVPPYSGRVAKDWGRTGPPEGVVPTAQKHIVKTTAKVMEVADLANALYHGYPLSVCSNQGFDMSASSDGFHHPRGAWGHAMAVVGYEDHATLGLYFIILNSWGDQFGRLKDFTTGEDLPVGVLRVRANVLDSMLKADGGDSFAYSQFDGYPGNGPAIDKALFDLVGLGVE